jgi:hypothetical protein
MLCFKSYKVKDLERKNSELTQKCSDLEKQNALLKNQGKINEDEVDDNQEMIAGLGQGASETCVR